MRGRARSLQARLLLWFIGAILLALGATAITTWITSSDNDYPSRVVTRHVQQRVARLWDDPVATDRYIAELREDTGLDVRVRRDASMFGGQGRMRPGGMIFEGDVAYVPVQRRGETVGALEIRTGTPPPRPWRVGVALVVALLALSLGARRVAMRLAKPLEHVAATAERFGAGDLDARTGVDKLSRRWVADEVRDLGRSFDGMADRISRVVVEQRELLAAISHELRSPLGRARVALEIARERSPDRALTDSKVGDALVLQARALDDVEKQLGEVDVILGDLLASARAGLADLRRQRIDVPAWVRERAKTETTGPVEVVLEKKSAAAEIDPALLGRALHNLLANAWAHGHPKAEPLVVTVRAAEDGFVRVEVRDRGPGFAAEILPRAFDPFVTGTGAARSPGAHGIGLGLSLVRRIVEAHGGRVFAANVDEVDEGEATGAVVGFELPPISAPKAAADKLAS
ncbi:MAG: HAMP domain-containing protein [Labilithrix sp.]|nr:HAMP domain-containing protein [Labilithrix sp.]MCW5810263.1 HAMP domain-containing protein [Labilithrix sp.]